MHSELFLTNPRNRHRIERARRAAVHPQQRAPRWGLLLWALIAVLLLLVNVFLVRFLATQWQEWWGLQQHGIPASARVLDRYYELDSEGQPTFYVAYSYEYTLPNGKPRQGSGTDKVSRQIYDTLPPETELTVTVHANDPTISRIRVFALWEMLFISLAFVLVVGVLALPAVVLVQRLWQDQRGHIIYGNLLNVSGEIASHPTKPSRIRVEYSFPDPTGHQITATSHVTVRGINSARLPPRGTMVAVWYVRDGVYRLL